MSSPEIAVSILCPAWSEAVPDVEALCRRVALAALMAEAADSIDAPLDRLEVSLVLADDAMVQTLNRQYRGQDKPTNVLSFASLDTDKASGPDDGPILLGDVVLAYQTTIAEATVENKAMTNHLSHLVVHGILHLLGYDHLEEAEAEEMESVERQILGTLDVPDPYAP